MTRESQQHEKVSRRHRKHEKKTYHPSPNSVFSPQNCTFLPRVTIQRTPRKLCTLTLPPPLPTLFDDPSVVERNPSTNPRHHRAPSDFTATAVSIDPTLITESSHPTPGRHHSGASVSTPDIPTHLRIGMACDPLIAYGLVLVATTDGRVAVYRLTDYGLEVDEDVVASEQRRRLEWEEEDLEYSTTVDEEEEKKSMEHLCANDDDEEQEEAIERMTRRERSRECVDPILVISIDATHHSQAEHGTNPLQSNAALPMIVGMCATPRGMSLIQGKSKNGCHIGHVAVLTDDGGVHILEFLSSDSAIKVSDMENVNEEKRDVLCDIAPVVNRVRSFRTQYLGATCICMQPIFVVNVSVQRTPRHYDQDPINASKESTSDENISNFHQIRLCIGHECGVLECYQLYLPSTQSGPFTLKDKSDSDLSSPYSLAKSKSNEIPRSNSTSPFNNDTPKRNNSFRFADLAIETEDKHADDSFEVTARLFRTYSEPTDPLLAELFASQQKKKHGSVKLELCWRGKTNVPIRSVACPGWSRSLAAKKTSSLIVVGLMQRSSENSFYETDLAGLKSNSQELSPAISLEVIDASLAQAYWLHMKHESRKGDTTVEDLSLTTPLNECSVWAAPGMEVKDGWTRDLHIESPCRTIGLRSVSITNKICHFTDNDPCFASAASDGTVTISHYNVDGSWGIHHECNQIMLPQRCIGIGAVSSESLNHLRRYICCCLRGGTIYLVPVIEHGQNKSNCIEKEITTFAVPVDSSGEDDGVLRYVQNFASGMVHVTRFNEQSSLHSKNDVSLKPVALVGWNGGTIDVYEVFPSETQHDNVLFQLLVDNGLVSKLVERLLIVNRSHPLISSLLWCKAWDECNKNKDIEGILKGIKDVSRSDFTSTRALLMSFINF